MKHYSYNGDSIEFSLMLDAKEVYIIGSFTNWEKRKSFKLERKGQFLYLKKNIKEISKIGNSGYAEYYLWNEEEQKLVPFDKNYEAGYYFNNQVNGEYNYLILPPNISKDELQQIEIDCKKSFRIKAFLEEFDTAQELGNFREVIGGELARNMLYRSYHPLIPSRADNYKLRDIEVYRQRVVRELMDLKGINTVINLSETKEELDNFIKKDKMSYYKKLWTLGSVYNIPISYETVYFGSNKDNILVGGELGFQSGIRKLIETIASSEGPYLVHCRLGSDRTGVIIAFLQLFMGTERNKVEESYILTNDLGIGEYRSFRLLELALKRALGERCFESSKELVVKYLINLGLNRSIIDKAHENLKSKLK